MKMNTNITMNMNMNINVNMNMDRDVDMDIDKDMKIFEKQILKSDIGSAPMSNKRLLIRHISSDIRLKCPMSDVGYNRNNFLCQCPPMKLQY
jgi:hypothetical protein